MRAATARSPRPGRGAPLAVRRADGVAWLQLQRPAAGNRVTLDLAQALCDAVEDIEADDRTVVVALTAAGASFCVGVEDGGAWEARADWVAAVGRLTRPVVAVIQGDALAEGLELALACDLRVASTRARLALPQLAEGRLPRHGGTQRLPRLVGRSRALDLLLTGRHVAGRAAEAMGLVSRIVPPADLASAADELVRALRDKGPIALRYAKEAVVKGGDLTLDQGIRLEEDLYVLLQTTDDRRAGVEAFLGKRRPVFVGK
jgi:enoyl-CoA hydratase